MKVSVRTAAREDILRQYRYYLVDKDAALVAEHFLNAVQAAVEALSHAPEMGSPKYFDNPLLAGLRTWPVPGFPSMRIYYIRAGSELQIVRVLHGKRDIGSLLEEDEGD